MYKIDEVALFKIQYGLYVVTSKADDKLNGQIATTVMQVTDTPIKVMVGLSKNTLTHDMVQDSNAFGVSVLAQDAPMTFIGKFGYKSGRKSDKFSDTNFEENITGVPLVLDHAVMVLEANVIQTLDIETHTLFVGELQSNRMVQGGEAMTYEYYHTVLRGKSPENAPTYIKPKK